MMRRTLMLGAALAGIGICMSPNDETGGAPVDQKPDASGAVNQEQDGANAAVEQQQQQNDGNDDGATDQAAEGQADGGTTAVDADQEPAAADDAADKA